MSLEKPLVGACGVFHVSAELSRRGWVAMPTIRNKAGIDIIASKEDRDVKIQVKTNSYGKIKYPMSKSNEDLIEDNLYYIFVTLKNEFERPDFYVVNSILVADYIKKTHEKWVTMPPRTKSGRNMSEEERIRKRSASTMRQFPNYAGNMIPEFQEFSIEDYKDEWDLLELV